MCRELEYRPTENVHEYQSLGCDTLDYLLNNLNKGVRPSRKAISGSTYMITIGILDASKNMRFYLLQQRRLLLGRYVLDSLNE